MKHYDPVVCTDGFTMSVQAGKGLYCSPRVDDAPAYREVEVRGSDELFEKYSNDRGDYADYEDPDPTEYVLAYMPVEVVAAVIAKHGGLKSGEVPPGVDH